MADLTLRIDLDQLPAQGRHRRLPDEPSWRAELTHVLRTTADQLAAGWYPTPNDLPTVFDTGGNPVGRWEITGT